MEEIINSVMQSPENTNPNVLRSQLQSVGGGSGGGGGAGYTVTETKKTLANETVTGQPHLNESWANHVTINSPLNANNAIVTYNGVEYEVEKQQGRYDYFYYGGSVDDELGTYDFSEYPFVISANDSYSTVCFVVMNTQGPNSVKIEVVEKTVTPDGDFKNAVRETVGNKDYTVNADKRNMLFTETVTEFERLSDCWTANLQAEPITAEWVVIALNGEEYLCHRNFENGEWYYGENTFSEITFTNYPFTLLTSGNPMRLVVPDNQEYTITATLAYPKVKPMDDFVLAVNDIADKQNFYDGERSDVGAFYVQHNMASLEFFESMKRGGIISVDSASEEGDENVTGITYVCLRLLSYYDPLDPGDEENPPYLLVGDNDGNVYKSYMDMGDDLGYSYFELQS